MNDLDGARTTMIPQLTTIEFAALSEKVLVEADGVFSLIRIINRIRPEEITGFAVFKEVQLSILLIEGAEESPPHRLQVFIRFPDGQSIEGEEIEFEFPDGFYHMTHVYAIGFGTEQPGLHSFDIYINGRLGNRVFLQSIIPAGDESLDQAKSDNE